MTIAYYIKKLLPGYIHEIQKARIEKGIDLLFQQDNNSSHGTRGKNESLVSLQLRINWIAVHEHPA